MRFGFCTNLNFLLNGDEHSRQMFEAVLKAGYDYIEIPLSAVLQLSVDQYLYLKKRLADANTPCRANFLLFPHELPLVGEKLDLQAISAHTKRVLPIAADLGSEVVVFGNGGSRRVQEGMDAEEVRNQLVEIMKVVNPIAKEWNIKIALEPLCTRETNMVTSFPEAAKMAEASGAQIGAVCDLYHFVTDGQSPDEVLECPEKLFHMHIAYPDGRSVPSLSDDFTHYYALKKAAEASGYDARLSIEANAPKERIEEVVAGGLAVLKEIFG